MSDRMADDLWATLRDRLREWTGNLLSVASRESSLEILAELARQRRTSTGRLLTRADHDAEFRQALVERLVIRTTWFMREPDAILGLASQFRQRAQSSRAGR